MAEMLVRAVDKINPDSQAKDARCLKRGDVVVVVPNDWPWSVKEQTDPQWRIVRAPDMTMDEARTFTVPEFPDLQVNPHPRRRGFFIDIDGLPTGHRNWFNDTTRVDPMRVIPAAVLFNAKTQKTTPQNLNANGANRRVIG